MKNILFLKYIISIFLLDITFCQKVIENLCYPANDVSRVVIAGGSITEIFYLLGIEDMIVAVDITSNFPEEAKKYPTIGYVRMLSTEGVLSMRPTLVIGENDMGPSNVIDQINSTGVELKIVPEKKTAQGVIAKIRCIASIMNMETEADKMIGENFDDLLFDLERKRKKVVNKNISAMVIYSMQGTSPIVSGSGESGDAFLKMTGAENAFSSFEGWKPATAEAIITNDPDFIIVTNRLLKRFSNLDELKNHPALAQTTAAKNNHIIAQDGMAMMGFGPRTIECALEVSNKFLNN